MILPRDKKGREILLGDTIKVFHFIGSRRKKHYMYKYVSEIVKLGGGHYYRVLHLHQSGDFYHIPLDGHRDDKIEIVQGYDARGVCFEYREVIK